MKNPKTQLIERILSLRSAYRRKISGQLNRSYSNNISQNEDELFKKGTEFEAFVVKRFNTDEFTLIEWRSDKNIDGIYPIMSRFPDLEFYYQNRNDCHQFAIECKWKEHFYKESIILNGYQLENYLHYETVTGYTTFIIIGIGNTPSNPNSVYILPVRTITKTRLHEFDLEIYRRPKSHQEFKIKCQEGILSLH